MLREWQIKFAARVVKQGGVIAYPTEAVWGLGCDPFNAHAVQHVLDLKRRPESKGLILISGQTEHFDPMLTCLPLEMQSRFREAQSRPTTWLVPDVENQIPSFVKGSHASVALRVTTHPVVSALTAALGHPLISTSANRSGREAAKSTFKIRQQFGGELDYILPAALGTQANPSVIRDLSTNQTIRA